MFAPMSDFPVSTSRYTENKPDENRRPQKDNSRLASTRSSDN
jgi:hypothetical protein